MRKTLTKSIVFWVLLVFISALLGVFIGITTNSVRTNRARREIAIVNEIRGWRADFSQVDRISVQLGTAYMVTSRDESAEDFAYDSAMLYPFARGEILGNSMVDFSRMNEIGRIVYYVGDVELFSASILQVQPNREWIGIEQNASYLNGMRVVVLLGYTRSVGWLGGFSGVNLDFGRLFDR